MLGRLTLENYRRSSTRPHRGWRFVLSIWGMVIMAAFTNTGACAEDRDGGGPAPPPTNRLIHATSPYLLQHAHNPVNWYPWGPEALQRAAKEDKPIFLSIGYSACHWCHVMEHESFENQEVAALLNEHFISIKVDREERPDLDEIYMRVTQSLNRGHGGWPMSLFLTPQQLPFMAGTYYPREQFLQLLTRVAEAWTGDRERITSFSEDIGRSINEWARRQGGDEIISRAAVGQAVSTIATYFDAQRGGIGRGNKFPPSMAMELMLRDRQRNKSERITSLVEVTLEAMANGGIYDHLGGGICRYATDPDWLVPHFEKMLYDQALVSAIFLDGFQALGKPLYARRAREILDYCVADLQAPEGAFYSTRDADSAGLEGAYYIWTVEQVREVLGEEDAEIFCWYYDVTPRGNWFESRGHAPAGPKNILHVVRSGADVAERLKLTPDAFDRKLAAMRHQLLAARAKRVPPGLDDKSLTSWNGLIIASLAKGAVVLDEPKFAGAAARAADSVLRHMRDDRGRLLRSYRAGQAHLTGYLSDYAFFIDGLLNLYEATFEPRWLTEAAALNEILTEDYFDAQGGAYFFTSGRGEKLITRTRNANDGAIPSGNSVQALNLLRLAILLDRPDDRTRAESIFRAFEPMVTGSPGSIEKLLCSVDFYHGPVQEIAIVGDPADPRTRQLLRVVRSGYHPNKVVVLAADDEQARRLGKHIALLKGKTRINGAPTAFVCENYACRKPTTSPQELAAQLEQS